MLSTAHHVIDGNENDLIPYKMTHINHPCSIWVRKTMANYLWMRDFTHRLCVEYTYRYERIHKTFDDALPFLMNPPNRIDPSNERTPFAIAMPDACKTIGDAVASYRTYYNECKSHLFAWRKRSVPFWIENSQ